MKFLTINKQVRPLKPSVKILYIINSMINRLGAVSAGLRRNKSALCVSPLCAFIMLKNEKGGAIK